MISPSVADSTRRGGGVALPPDGEGACRATGIRSGERRGGRGEASAVGFRWVGRPEGGEVPSIAQFPNNAVALPSRGGWRGWVQMPMAANGCLGAAGSGRCNSEAGAGRLCGGYPWRWPRPRGGARRDGAPWGGSGRRSSSGASSNGAGEGEPGGDFVRGGRFSLRGRCGGTSRRYSPWPVCAHGGVGGRGGEDRRWP